MTDAFGREAHSGDPWRGTDFSGVTVIWGLGGGQLARLLMPQIERNEGTLVILDSSLDELHAYAGVAEPGPWSLVQAHPRRTPLLAETVDLLVVNGILRQIPEGRLPLFFEELWRALVPGGQLRVSDILEPSEASYNAAWAERNRIITRLGEGLGAGVATGVDLKQAALAARSAGFEDLSVAILPGYALTDAWLEETIEAARTMASRVADALLRQRIVNEDLPRLVEAYHRGEQRAAERFVLKGVRAGDMSLTMEAGFTEEDLVDPDL